MLRRNKPRRKDVEKKSSVHITRGDIGCKFQETYRVVFLGAAGVGKTNIISQFLGRDFCIEHIPTIEDMHHGFYEVDGSRVKLDILDTTGSYPFPAMRRLAIHCGDAFVLVYSVDNEDSYEEAKRLRKEILIERESDTVTPAIVFVGNKSDLGLLGKRKIPQETASMTAIDWGNGHVETSAKENRNIADVFKEVFMQPYFMFLRRRKYRRSSSSAILSLLNFNNPIAVIGSDGKKQTAAMEKLKQHSKKFERSNSTVTVPNLSPMLNVRKFNHEPSKHSKNENHKDHLEDSDDELKNSYRYQTRRMGFSSSAVSRLG